MALIKKKNHTGRSEIEKRDFNNDYFTKEREYLFKGASVSSYSAQIKSDLNKLSDKYEKIADKMAQVLKTCGGKGKKIDPSSGIGKEIKKFEKACDNRAKYCKNRKTTLANAMEKVTYEQIDINTQDEKSVATAAQNATKSSNDD